MRRQAVALLVHRDVSQVNALINILQTSFDVFVHIDKKSDISPKSIASKRVWKEITVHWGGYNMIEATVFLYRQILATGIPYSHVILLSGDAVPVKSNAYIADYLNAHPGISFLENRPADDVCLERRRLYWFNEDLKKTVRGISRFLNSFKMIRWIQRRLQIWRSTEGFERTGSQWTILALPHVQHLVHKCRLSKYKFMAVPDESFVQNHFTNYSLAHQKNLIYAHWPGKRSLSPNYIDEETFLSLLTSPYLFARKLRPEVEDVRRSKYVKVLRRIQGSTQLSRIQLQFS